MFVIVVYRRLSRTIRLNPPQAVQIRWSPLEHYRTDARTEIPETIAASAQFC